jgi:hypothetical protein
MTRAATFAATLALVAPALTAGATTGPSSVAIAAWPARVIVVAPGLATIHVDNPGSEPAVLDVAPSSYALDLRGRPRIGGTGRDATRGWLRVAPAHLAVGARATARLSVNVVRPRAARPGDHAFVVVLTTRLPSRRKVLARLRIGVVVVVRVPGVVVRRLTLGKLHVRRRGRRVLFEQPVANGGNLDEWVARRRLEIRLVRRGRIVARLQAEPRRLLALSRGLVEATYGGRLRGRLNAVVVLMTPRPGVAMLRRTFRLLL